jgi:hypothetical protein
MALSIGLDVSFDNLQDWKGIRKKAEGSYFNESLYKSNKWWDRWILNGCYTSNYDLS